MTSTVADPLDALLLHNLWATRVILERCRSLTPEQFSRAFPIGPGEHAGLHAICTHIVGAMRRWTDRIRGGEIRPPLESWRPGYAPRPEYTPDELLSLLDDAHLGLTAVLADTRTRGPEREVVLRFPGSGVSHTLPAGVALASALVHGHYHRAQCMNILRRLGAWTMDEPSPGLDVIDWHEALRSNDPRATPPRA